MYAPSQSVSLSELDREILSDFRKIRLRNLDLNFVNMCIWKDKRNLSKKLWQKDWKNIECHFSFITPLF